MQQNFPHRSIKILILEDVTEDARLIRYELEKANFIINAKIVDDEASFVLALEHFFPDVILSDYNLPVFSGLDALLIAQETSPNTPFVFVTGAIGEEIAAETIINGASGFVLKSNLTKLPPLIDKLLREVNWRKQRIQQTSQRIQARIAANIEALERISEFLQDKEDTGEREAALEDVKRLKEGIQDENDLFSRDKSA